jgi:hypothetical protein
MQKRAPENIFPPSSGGFYGRMVSGSELAIYIIQEIENDPRFWLTIIDSEYDTVYEAHTINPYEIGVLKMIDDAEFDSMKLDKIAGKNKAVLWERLMGVLDEPSPSWEEILLLKEDVIIPNLTVGKTARETLEQLVPDSFPEDIRTQIMIFLAIAVKRKIPSEDPVSYFSELSVFPLLRALLIINTQCILDETKQPPYAKLMALAARKELRTPKRIQQETLEDQSWIAFWNKVAEMFPDWKNIAIRYAQKLNKSGKIVLRLPVSKSEASKSRKLWKDRLGMMSEGLLIRAISEPRAFGLRQMVYLGSAYRWPHHHMSWTCRLGSISEHTPHMQIMVMSQSAAERVKRFLPAVIEIGWSARAVNFNLYNEDEKRWIVSVSKLTESISDNSTKTHLNKEYGTWSGEKIHRPTREEMKVVDLVSKGIFLADSEFPSVYEEEGLSEFQIRSTLSKLNKLGALKQVYEIIDDTLIAIVTIAQGASNNIYSLVESFLKNTPTSLAMINDTSDQCIIISRFPEESIYDLVKSLTTAGRRAGLTIRCIRPSSIKSYTHNLYQRLLREDGTWDDDVSAFLSQARSKRRELSEREIKGTE